MSTCVSTVFALEGPDVESPYNRQMIAAVLALQATDARTIYKRVSPAICTVTQSVMKGESTGTGFAVNGGWQIVTASHVVPSEWGEIQVSGRIKCALVYRDREADVAILRPSRKLPYSIALAKREPEIGATVFSVGQALGALENTMVSGMFNGRRVVEGEAMYQHSAPLSSGMSGGPLLDESGLVIGVNKYKTAENAGLNFSSTLPALRKAIKDAAGIVRSEI
ncbi:serine protease, partial [bacterium]